MLRENRFIAHKQEQQHPTASRLVGLCTGAFAAAAISCSNTLFDVARMGVQAVIVAFRIGMHVHRRARILGHPTRGCWSLVVSSMEEEAAKQILTDLYTAQVSQAADEVVVSLADRCACSGPPTVLGPLHQCRQYKFGDDQWPAQRSRQNEIIPAIC